MLCAMLSNGVSNSDRSGYFSALWDKHFKKAKHTKCKQIKQRKQATNKTKNYTGYRQGARD